MRKTADVIQYVSRKSWDNWISYRKRVIEIKNREHQRANRRLKNKEELLDRKNSLGVKDLTAYNAVKQIATNGKASIAWKLTTGKLVVFYYKKKGAIFYGKDNYECAGIICTDGN